MTTDHKSLIRAEFTKQADAYAAAPLISDPRRVERLVTAVAPRPDSRVLEVATGPGYVAMGFAAVCREVIGVDLTEAPLVIARRTAAERGLSNVRFQTGDAEQLPFAGADFDIVVCRLAFHHFEDPPRVLHEMARLCRPGGAVAVEDVVVSEFPERAAYQNHWENLRDPSHTRAYTLSELLAMCTRAGLEVRTVYTSTVVQDVEHWLARAQTPPDRAAQARSLLREDAAHDLSGTAVTEHEGRLTFVHTIAALVARRLR